MLRATHFKFDKIGICVQHLFKSLISVFGGSERTPLSIYTLKKLKKVFFISFLLVYFVKYVKTSKTRYCQDITEFCLHYSSSVYKAIRIMFRLI